MAEKTYQEIAAEYAPWPISPVRSSLFTALVLISAALILPSHLALAQSVFTQQGPKLVGTGVGFFPFQGWSVAVSAVGNTAIVGAPGDNDIGAAWIFTRSKGVWTQQGGKLLANDAVGPSNPNQGWSVALSADGNTALVGGIGDNSVTGAVYVYTRSGGNWTQQGSKLFANDAVTYPYGSEQGYSVALSADGNTALVGGRADNSYTGATWVYTRSGGVWTQQGAKLVANDAVGQAQQGTSVALSANGNTAIVGGPYDNNNTGGAMWVYTRSSGVWTQQGSKLVGTGAVGGTGKQGTSVGLSGDGNTAIVGGPSDNYDPTSGFAAGAAWVFTRSNDVWTQQGTKLVGSDAVQGDSGSRQGNSVAVSGNGNTAIVGGPVDNFNVGAAWVFTRSGTVWTQQGSKLVGIGAVGNAQQGSSVALSADGQTAIVGGPVDNGGTIEPGAAWVFVERSKVDCQKGGWLNFIGPPGPFTNQGRCVSYFAKQK
jgi:hypothetical protein